MTEKAELTPYFERTRSEPDCLDSEGYVAGLRGRGNAHIAVQITLPAEVVDRAVLVGAQLSISLAPDGHLVLDGEQVDDEILDAASTAGGLCKQTLETLVTACLDPDLLAGDGDVVADLASLRGQLVSALARLDDTLAQLKQE